MNNSAVSTLGDGTTRWVAHFRSQGRDIPAASCLIQSVTRIVGLSQMKIDIAGFLVGFRRQGFVDLVISLTLKSSHLTVRGFRPRMDHSDLSSA
jgi:hypothetical protein